MCAICPHCGADLTKDEPIERAGLSMFPYGNARVGGAEIKLTKAESGVLYTLLKAEGQMMPQTAIAERIGYEGDDPAGLINVHINRIRRKLAPHWSVPIRSLRGVGVYIEA